MDREFLEHYERELTVLQEQAAEFAAEYPGIADRLGGLAGENVDPTIVGLLQGSAFLAARVQLKLSHEFPEFTTNLLDQLVPDLLVPQPSSLLVRAQPTFGDPALLAGKRIQEGSYLDATFVERDRRVACRYRLGAQITMWPFELVRAEYLGDAASLTALGAPIDETARAGLRLSFTTRMSPKPETEISEQEAQAAPPFQARACSMDELKIHLVGPPAVSIALYEQIFAQRRQVFLRHLDAFGDPACAAAGPDCVGQIGFDGEDALSITDNRIFEGFARLREYFQFEQKYLGFRLRGLRPLLSRVAAKSFDVIITFSDSNPRLKTAITGAGFALYAAPATNLFQKALDRIPIRSDQHEFHVVADRSRPLDYEPHRITEVFAYRSGQRDKEPVAPLYGGHSDAAPSSGLYYTVRRLPRRRTASERQYGQTSNYTGTELFLSLIDTRQADGEVAELSVRAFCSNRHLTEQLPVGAGGADFRLSQDTSIELYCAAGPTPPREPVLRNMRSRAETASTGSVAWRLINMLSLNHLGLLDRSAGHNAQALREILSLFADFRDAAVERRIAGVRSLGSRPIVRRVRRKTGVGMARGLEITVTFDDKAFEGSGVFLLGAVLDRFFAEYVAINNFTQTVIVSLERGEIMRWPVRLGARSPI